jgi:hemoglobin
LQQDPRLGRFWQYRGTDGLRREKQLLIDYLRACAGGPLLYTGRDMKTSHAGMRIDAGDWQVFTGHIAATLDSFGVPAEERTAVLGFFESLKDAIVE